MKCINFGNCQRINDGVRHSAGGGVFLLVSGSLKAFSWRFRVNALKGIGCHIQRCTIRSISFTSDKHSRVLQ